MSNEVITRATSVEDLMRAYPGAVKYLIFHRMRIARVPNHL